MSDHSAHHAVSSPPIPSPRSAGTENAAAPGEAGPARAQAESPAREPYTRRVRPRTEYWDVTTASWHTAAPVPRTGD